MTKCKFFKRAPPEVLQHIYSQLDSPEHFLNAWETCNKYQQRAIEGALFRKKGIAFYPIQFKLLAKLKNLAAANDKTERGYLNELARNFGAQLTHPELSFGHKIQGLKLIAAINNVSLPLLDPAPTAAQLRQPDNNLVFTALEDLAKLAPLFDIKTLPALIKQVQQKLEDEDENVRAAALTSLVRIAPLAGKKTLASIVEQIQQKLKQGNRKLYYEHMTVRAAALTSLTRLAPLLGKETQESIVKQVEENLNDRYLPVRAAALTSLVKLAPLIEKESQDSLLKLVSGKLDHQYWIIRKAALTSLARLAPLMDKETQDSIVKQVERKLDDSHVNVRAAAFTSLAKLAPLLGKEKLASLVEQFKQKLNDKNKDVRQAICEFMMCYLFDLNNHSIGASVPDSKDSEKILMLEITTENLLVQTLSHWVSQIKMAATSLKNENEEPELIEDKKGMVC